MRTLTSKELSQKRLEEYRRFSQLIQWGRSNPVRFAEEFFGIGLMDNQKWCFMQSWYTPFCLWLHCRGAGKTTLAAILLKTKTLLIPNYTVYIATNSSTQSIESFKKIEDIALQRIPSFRDATDIYANEIEKTPNSETGFIHDKSGHYFRLYNDSGVITLSSNITTARGKRGAVFFDECGWQSKEQLATLENFINVDASFRIGVGGAENNDPDQVPLQLLYASSASDVSFPFYEKFVTFSKKMFLGNSNYFVCDFNCDLVLNKSSVNGVPIKSHLTREQIDKSFEEDKDLAMRELYNQFSSGYSENSVVKMDTLIRNSTVRPPLLYNDTGTKRFILTYDPARNFDGSVMAVFQIHYNENIGYHLSLENMVSMVDRESKNKTPLPMSEQLKIIKKMMIDYNGEKSAEWENIELYIDAGAGGGGISAVADALMEDWTDDFGTVHRGVIDPTHKQYETSRRRYTRAAPIIHLLEPTSHKRLIFDALEKMTKFDLINFPDYDNKDVLLLQEGDTTREYKLSEEERISLVQCNLAKHEMIYINRFEIPGGSVRYDLAREKKSSMHDDRAYAVAMGAYALQVLRRNDLNKPIAEVEPMDVPVCITEIQF